MYLSCLTASNSVPATPCFGGYPGTCTYNVPSMPWIRYWTPYRRADNTAQIKHTTWVSPLN